MSHMYRLYTLSIIYQKCRFCMRKEIKLIYLLVYNSLRTKARSRCKLYKEPSPPRAYVQFVLLPTTECKSPITISAFYIQNIKINAFKDTREFSNIVQSLNHVIYYQALLYFIDM